MKKFMMLVLFGALVLSLGILSVAVEGSACICDTDCSGYSCDTTGACATSCTEDGGCAAGYYCNGGSCETESSSRLTSCSSGYVCGGAYACDIADERCYDSCTTDSECNSGYTCDSCSGTCVATCVDSSCGKYRCDKTTNACETSCTSDDQCDSDAACITASSCGSNAACIAASSDPLNECVVCEDSDKDSYSTKGTVTGPTGDDGYYASASVDYCTDDDTLIEYRCAELTSTTYLIGYGHLVSCSTEYGSGYTCSGGVCVAPPYTCSDSDGSTTRYQVYGAVTITGSDGSTSTASDSCSSFTKLVEKGCASSTSSSASSKIYDCSKKFGPSYSCLSGVCTKTSTISAAPEYDSGSPTTWVLVGVGVLVIIGAAYFMYGRKPKSKKK